MSLKVFFFIVHLNSIGIAKSQAQQGITPTPSYTKIQIKFIN